MKNRKLAAGVAGLCLTLGVSGVAVAANSAAVPRRVTIEQKQSVTFKPNHFVTDTLRWSQDAYVVKSGGTLHLVNSVIAEGPHTFSVVRKKDYPTTWKQVQNCRICKKFEQAHGADPNSQGPPKFFFLENGTGSPTPPKIDRPGDSVLIGPGQKRGESVNVKVTAKRGTTLYFMCIIHPWMQSKVIVK